MAEIWCAACRRPIPARGPAVLAGLDEGSFETMEPWPELLRPFPFHPGCPPEGWQVVAGPMPLADILRVRAGRPDLG